MSSACVKLTDHNPKSPALPTLSSRLAPSTLNLLTFFLGGLGGSNRFSLHSLSAAIYRSAERRTFAFASPSMTSPKLS